MKQEDPSPKASPPRSADPPADPNPDRHEDSVDWDGIENAGQTTITGYWAAPSIRGLGKLKPRRGDDIRLAKSGRAASENDPEQEIARLARLADEARRCTTELGALLSRLTNLPLPSKEKTAEEEPEAADVIADGASAAEKPAETSVASFLPDKTANRVFKPQGVVTTPPVKPITAHFKKGRLIFSCPACNYTAELFAEAAGKKTRCPNCFSAIRAPHPKEGIAARNMEQQKEALLWPERFKVTVPPESRDFFPRVCVPGVMLIAKTAAFLILSAIAVELYLVGFRTNAEHEVLAEESAGEAFVAQADLRQRAEDVVRRFLEAGSWQEKMRMIRRGETLFPAVKSYYEAHPGQATAEYLTLTANAPGFYTFSDVKHMATEVAVQFKNYDVAVFTVEHLPEGDLIEWETSVGYNPVGFGELARRNEAEETQRTFRVLASGDDYYNYEFDRANYLCIRLQDPGDNSLLAYGYIDRDTLDAKEIDFLLSAASPDHPERLIVEVNMGPDVLETRQVEVTKLVQAGWRSDIAMNATGTGPADGGSNKRFRYEFSR